MQIFKPDGKLVQPQGRERSGRASKLDESTFRPGRGGLVNVIRALKLWVQLGLALRLYLYQWVVGCAFGVSTGRLTGKGKGRGCTR